jgi:hypothetical protein
MSISVAESARLRGQVHEAGSESSGRSRTAGRMRSCISLASALVKGAFRMAEDDPDQQVALTSSGSQPLGGGRR